MRMCLCVLFLCYINLSGFLIYSFIFERRENSVQCLRRLGCGGRLLVQGL